MRSRRGTLVLLGLAAACAAPPEEPPRRAAPQEATPPPAPAAEPEVAGDEEEAAAPPKAPERPRRSEADEARIAALLEQLERESGRPPPAAPPPAPPEEPGPSPGELTHAEVAAEVARLRTEARGVDVPEPGAARFLEEEAATRLERIYDRLRGLRLRLIALRRHEEEAVRAAHAERDAPLAREEQRLLKRSTAVVLGQGQAYVDSPAEELEAVRVERRALEAEREAALARIEAVYVPDEEAAGRALREVAARLREARVR